MHFVSLAGSVPISVHVNVSETDDADLLIFTTSLSSSFSLYRKFCKKYGSEKHRKLLTSTKVFNMGAKMMKVDDKSAHSYGVSILANLTNPLLYKNEACAHFMMEGDAIGSLIYTLVKDFEFTEDNIGDEDNADERNAFYPEKSRVRDASDDGAKASAESMLHFTSGYRTVYLAACALLSVVNCSDTGTTAVLSKLDVSALTRLRYIKVLSIRIRYQITISFSVNTLLLFLHK